MNNPTTITLDAELIRETLIALRDRAFTLCNEVATTESPAVRNIALRQLARVEDARMALAASVGEGF